MRTILNINRNWRFAKDWAEVPETLPSDWEAVNVPHCWNAVDGQDGGADYFRGKCSYVKQLDAELPEADRYYLEIRGANASADVYLDGQLLTHHDGGYSTFRCDITENPRGLLTIVVDNSPSDSVYPQVADFTFYGGLYRDVNLICVSSSHFDLDYFGTPGIKVTPVMDGGDAKVAVETWITNRREGQTVRYSLKNAAGKVIGSFEGGRFANFRIKNAHRWHGRKDPYLPNESVSYAFHWLWIYK